MSPEFSDKDMEGYIEARRFAKELGKEIAGNIKAGMTEKDVEEIAAEVFNTYKVKQHWHMPVIGAAEGSTKLRSAYALASSFLTRDMRVMQENDIVLIDIAPVYEGYPSDYTYCHVLGSNPELEALVTYAEDVSRKIAAYVRKEMVVADVFRYAQEVIHATSNYTLAYPPFISMGHRLCKIPPLWQKFPEAGLTYLLLKTRGAFINSNNRNMMDGLWVIEPYLMHKERAAKFETLVFMGEESVILEG